MAFSYRIVLSPYAQEVLYTGMAQRGQASVGKYLTELLVRAAEDPATCEAALTTARGRVTRREH